MKINKYFQTFSQQIIICLRDYGLGEITIARNRDYKEDALVWLPTRINWAACGSQEVDKVNICISAMKKAVEFAGKLDRDEEITDDDLKA